MTKKILLTGATDGIGLETAKALASRGHHLLLHGRNEEKLNRIVIELDQRHWDAPVEAYVADLSDLAQVETLATEIIAKHDHLDVVINNAGVFSTSAPITADGLDVRFVVNTIAPYVLTRRLLPLLAPDGRVINLSSAAQAPVDLEALTGQHHLADNAAYAQSKLAITMWSRQLAAELGNSGPIIIAVNPGSLLASKMVRDAYGIAGKDITIGSDILIRAALDSEFASASGRYFDNDSGAFADPHPDALDPAKCAKLEDTLNELLERITR